MWCVSECACGVCVSMHVVCVSVHVVCVRVRYVCVHAHMYACTCMCVGV